MSGVRVFIATTTGPSEIQRVLPEDPEVRSVICLNGTATALPISGAYDAFVRRPTGVIARHYGHPVYRLDVSHAITSGHSWQLGVFLAHALLAEGRLGRRGAPEAYLTTGTVSHELEVGAVSNVVDKLEQARPLLQRLKGEGVRTTVVLPAANASDDGFEALAGELEAAGLCRFVHGEGIEEICRTLQIGVPAPAGRPTRPPARSETGTRRRGRIVIAAVLGLMVAGAAYAASSVWNAGFEEWMALAGQGRYREVAEGLSAAEAKGCASCVAARQAFLLYARLRRPETKDFELSASELRAPDGATCTTIDFGYAKPQIEPVSAALPEASGRGLCSIEYRLRNAGGEAAYAWLAVARTVPGGGEPESVVIQKGALAPGAELTATTRVPRWLRGPASNHVVAIVGRNPSQDIDAWLPQLLEANERRAGRSVTRLEQMGLAAASRRQVLTP